MGRSGIMLAYPFEEKRLAKWSPPYIIQPKLDGERCRAVWYGNSYVLLTSQENIFQSVPHILDELRRSDLNTVELDGELYCHGMPFENIHSIVSRQSENIHPDHTNISFYVFDLIIPVEQWKRTKLLEQLFTLSSFEHIRRVPNFECSTIDEVLNLYDRFIKEGFEGFIIREKNAVYKRSRSTFMMKFKPKQSDIYRIVGYEEEISIEGIPKGALGAIVCEKDDETFNVGTGYTRDQRIEMWKTRDSLIGKLAIVKYQHISSANQVPRFPVFVQVYDMESELAKLRGK